MGWELVWVDADGTPLGTYRSIERIAIDAKIAEWLAARAQSRIYLYRLRYASHGGNVTVLEQIVTQDRRLDY